MGFFKIDGKLDDFNYIWLTKLNNFKKNLSLWIYGKQL